ncbi:MAG: flagellin [Planctomycetota bacterium]
MFSLQAKHQYDHWTDRVGESFQRLSSGQILRKDDPAGWAVADKLRARSNGLEQAARNSLDGISLVQIADGTLGQTSEILQRLRELAVQAANGTLGEEDRASLQSEFAGFREEVDSLSRSTDFNSLPLLDGNIDLLTLQVGDGTALHDVLSVDLENASSAHLGIDGLDISTAEGARDALDAIDGAIDSVNASRGRQGAIQLSLENRVEALQTESEKLQASASRITDVDYAKETAELTRSSILQQASLAVFTQANLQPQIALRLLDAALKV